MGIQHMGLLTKTLVKVALSAVLESSGVSLAKAASVRCLARTLKMSQSKSSG